jgi:uncharacterized protein (DUF1330 family)
MPERILIIEFASSDSARQWYRSEDYRESFLEARLSASHGRVFLIEWSEISVAIPTLGPDAGSG